MTHTQGDTHKCPHAAPVQITTRGLYYPCTNYTKIYALPALFAYTGDQWRPILSYTGENILLHWRKYDLSLP